MTSATPSEWKCEAPVRLTLSEVPVMRLTFTFSGDGSQECSHHYALSTAIAMLTRMQFILRRSDQDLGLGLKGQGILEFLETIANRDPCSPLLIQQFSRTPRHGASLEGSLAEGMLISGFLKTMHFWAPYTCTYIYIYTYTYMYTYGLSGSFGGPCKESSTGLSVRNSRI